MSTPRHSSNPGPEGPLPPVESEKSLENGQAGNTNVTGGNLETIASVPAFGLESLQKMVEESQRMRCVLEEIKNEMSKKNARDTMHKEAFDKLYEEMKQYKENFIFEAMRPILMDIILLYDNVAQAEKHVQEEKMRSTLGLLKEQILEILYRQDVEPVTLQDDLQSGETKLDRKLQRVLKVISTEVPEEDGQRVEIVREGFLRAGRVLRLQEVICKKCQVRREP